MPKASRISDHEIVATVAWIRQELGACTYTTLARRLGMTKHPTHVRVLRLVERGWLETSSEPGSIRPGRESLLAGIAEGLAELEES